MSKDRLITPETLQYLPLSWSVCSGGRAIETQAQLFSVLTELGTSQPQIEIVNPSQIDKDSMFDFFKNLGNGILPKEPFLAAHHLMTDASQRLANEYNPFKYTDYRWERYVRNSMSGAAVAKLVWPMFEFLTSKYHGERAQIMVARDTINFVYTVDQFGEMNWLPQNKPVDNDELEKQRTDILSAEKGMLITGFALGAGLNPTDASHLTQTLPILERAIKFGGFPLNFAFFVDTRVQTAFFRFNKEAEHYIDPQAYTMSRPGGIKFEDSSVRAQMEWYVTKREVLHTLDNTHQLKFIDRLIMGGDWDSYFDLNNDQQVQINSLQQGQITSDQLSDLIIEGLDYVDNQYQLARMQNNMGNGRELWFLLQLLAEQGAPTIAFR